VLEASEGYWRHVPHVKRVIIKGVPEDTTRLAMLKKGEADIVIAFLDGAVAQEVQRAPQLTLVATRHPSLFGVEFADQWDPTSPWHDRRVRLDLALPVEPLPYDPAKAKQWLAETEYPHGFAAGDLVPIPPAFTVGEAVVNGLNAVGIRVTMRPMERAPFYAAWREKRLRDVCVTASGTSGNAATRVEAFISSKGAYAYGGDIDALFQQQAVERDRTTREALLHRIQQLTVERVMCAPIFDFRALHGSGLRGAEHTINAIPLYPFPAYEDIRLKAP
jgi:peptide/nickel transport system substrate-binding protein